MTIYESMNTIGIIMIEPYFITCLIAAW